MSKKGTRVACAILLATAVLSLAMTAGAESPNGITTPVEDGTIRGTTTIAGNANDPTFLKWQIDLVPANDINSPMFLALGATAGAFTASFDSAGYPDGAYLLRLRVVRSDGNYDEYETRITVANTAPARSTPVATAAAGTPAAPAATQSPPTTASPAGPAANGITAPAAGAAVTGLTTVRANANAPNFLKWQVDLVQASNAGGVIFLGSGRRAGAVSARLDSEKYPNGSYTLRLRVVERDGNYTEYTRGVTIANKTSLGPNGIVIPTDGAVVHGSLSLRGVAMDPQFQNWQLDLLQAGNPDSAMFLARSTVDGTVTASFNSAHYPNGSYVLRLRIVRKDGNYTEYTRNMTIANK